MPLGNGLGVPDPGFLDEVVPLIRIEPQPDIAPGPSGPGTPVGVARLTTAGGMPCGRVLLGGAPERFPVAERPLGRSDMAAALDPDLSMAATTDSHRVPPTLELPRVLVHVAEERVGCCGRTRWVARSPRPSLASTSHSDKTGASHPSGHLLAVLREEPTKSLSVFAGPSLKSVLVVPLPSGQGFFMFARAGKGWAGVPVGSRKTL